MKKICISFLMCFVAVALFAQNNAEILVGYNATAPRRQGKPVTTKMSLLASPTEAKYFNDQSLWIDSLKSTPEGENHYREIIKKTCLVVGPDGQMMWDLSKGPTKSEYTYVFTDNSKELIDFYGKFGSELGHYTEPLSEMEWTIVEDSTSSVLGYECIMAETDYHGRHWKAWFTPEIPLSFGPWKFHGLPGLVLKAEANGGFTFEATGLEKTARLMTPIYSEETYSNVDRKKALGEGEHYINNMAKIMSAQGQKVKITYTDDKGNEIDVPLFDGLKHCLEPDYKMK